MGQNNNCDSFETSGSHAFDYLNETSIYDNKRSQLGRSSHIRLLIQQRYLFLLNFVSAFTIGGDCRENKASNTGVLNLYSHIYALANFKSKIYPPNFFYFHFYKRLL